MECRSSISECGGQCTGSCEARWLAVTRFYILLNDWWAVGGEEDG